MKVRKKRYTHILVLKRDLSNKENRKRNMKYNFDEIIDRGGTRVLPNGTW